MENMQYTYRQYVYIRHISAMSTKKDVGILNPVFLLARESEVTWPGPAAQLVLLWTEVLSCSV